MVRNYGVIKERCLCQNLELYCGIYGNCRGVREIFYIGLANSLQGNIW